MTEQTPSVLISHP